MLENKIATPNRGKSSDTKLPRSNVIHWSDTRATPALKVTLFLVSKTYVSQTRKRMNIFSTILTSCPSEWDEKKHLPETEENNIEKRSLMVLYYIQIHVKSGLYQSAKALNEK